MLNINNSEFLTNEHIKTIAPSIFTATASSTVSSHYTHIPTSQVMEDMRQLGFGVVDVKQVKARKGIGFQKHLIVFRNPNIVINGADGDDVFPQILLTNSHDGKNAFTFKCAIFRMVCENGLVVSTQEFSDIKMRHMGYTFEELKEKINGIVEQLPLTVEFMNKMKNIQLNEKLAEEFATKALATRFKEEEIQHITVDIKELLKPTRKEDTGTDLWSVFNIIQEKIIDGDFNYNIGSKSRKARRIKNFQQDLKVNEQLFELALEFAN
jgi:hypothetical protein